MGYVYYGNYASYCEVARVEALREVGLSYRQLEEEYDILMPVLNFECRYLRPAKYDELLTIETSFRQFDHEKVSVRSEITNEADKLLSVAKVRLCYVEALSRKKTTLPQAVIDKIGRHFTP